MSEDGDHRTKRMAVRFTDADLAFLAKHAEDEGVEPATLVRMIVARLRKGRQPLISLMEARPMPRTTPGATFNEQIHGIWQPPVAPEPQANAAEADDILNSRLNELDSADVVQLHQPTEEEAAAIPLMRVPRQQYNPGRN